jgi:hypothetical protein
MDLNRAKEIAKLINSINENEHILKQLTDIDYPEENFYYTMKI